MAGGAAGVSQLFHFSVSSVASRIFLIGVLLTWMLLGQSSLASAQLTDPIEHSVEVTAIVPSTQPPPVPILRRPSNNAVTSEKRVEFRWEEVTGHVMPLDHYDLIVNGTTLFNNIALTDHETSEYTLTLQDGIYRLRLKQVADLDDGEYTWKVRVVDNQNIDTSSTTWKFTVDTSSPPLIITDIQGQNVSISASDPQTIPTEPVVVNVSQPFVYGSTEILAEVQLIVTRADGTQSNYQMTATDDGHFLFYLPELLANEIVELDLTAIDQAGNSRALSGVRIQYVPRRLVIPLPEVFPGQPGEVVIPLPDIPGILTPRPTPPTDPESGEPSVPTPPAPQVYEREVIRYSFWRMILMLLVFLYSLLIFVWTGNSFWVYPLWLPRFWRWLLLWPEGQDRATTPRGTGVPWVPMVFEWLVSEGKLRRRWIWTSPTGNFHYPQQFTSVQTLSVTHPKWLWLPLPADKILPDRFVGLQTEMQSRIAKKDGATTVVGEENFVWTWLKVLQPVSWRWQLRLVPRFFLVGMILVAVWLTWTAPVLESFLWLACTLWLLIRDVQGRLPSRWYSWIDTDGRQP